MTSMQSKRAARIEGGRLRRRLRPDLYGLEDRTLLNGSITVTTTSDSVDSTHFASLADLFANPGLDGKISLREAIMAANNDPSAAATPNTITLPDGTYNLTTGTAGTGGTAELPIGTLTNLNTILLGTSQAGTIINQSVSGARILNIDPPSNGNTLFSGSNFTLQNGTSTDGGGAVLFGGDATDQATFTNVLFKNNMVTTTATNAPGGAINDAGGTLTIVNSTFDSNTVGTVGTTNLGSGSGAIDVFPISNAVLNISGSTFINNKAAASASGAGGGAIRIATNGNIVTSHISGSTFTGNQVTSGATSGGGAIFLESGSLTVTDTNFSNNQITTSGAGEDAGGAIYAGGTLVANFNRFVGNSTAKAGAGNVIDFNKSGGGTINIEDNWWGLNTGPAAGDVVQTSPVAPLAPTHWLVLTNSANPASINVGATSTLTADFTHDNTGTDVSALDPATGHTFPAFIGLPVTYGAPVDGTLSNQQTTIQSGGTATATFTGTTLGGGSSTATVDGVTATANINVTASADLGVNISGPANALAGNQVTYTITVTNTGPSDAPTATITTTLPAGTTFVSHVFQGVVPNHAVAITQGLAGNVVTQTISPLKSGDTATFTVIAMINANQPAGTLSTTTTVSGTGITDPNPGNDSFTANTNVTTQADVTVSKSGPVSVIAGNQVIYTVTISNPGPSDAQGVSLADNLPAATSFVSQTQTGTGAQFTLGQVGNAITDTIATLAAGASQTFTITALVAAGTPAGTLSNTATATTTTSDPNLPTHGTSTANTAVTTQAALSVTGSGAAFVGEGSNLTYTFTISNTGPSDASGVTLTDTLPAGVTFNSALSTPGSSAAGQTITYAALGTIASGGNKQVTIVVTTSEDGSLANSATADAANATPHNVASNTITTAVVETDLTTTLTPFSPTVATPFSGQVATFTDTGSVDPNTAFSATIFWGDNSSSTGTIGGSNGSYTVSGTHTYSFLGTNLPFQVLVTENNTAQLLTATLSGSNEVPPNPSPGTGLASVLLDAGQMNITVDESFTGLTTYPAASHIHAPAPAGVNAPLLFALAGVPAATSGAIPEQSFAITAARVLQLESGLFYVNLHTAVFPSGELRGQLLYAGNATGAVNVANQADVTIVKTGPASAIAGGQITYQITTHNNGPGDAQGVVTSDVLPAHTTLVSFVQNTGPGNYGTLPAGRTQTFTLVVNVNANTTDGTVITNTANVSTTTNDPNLPTNGHSSVNTTINSQADVTVVKTGPVSVSAGNQITYSVVVSNAGPSPAQSVSLTDTLPAGTTFVSQTQAVGGAQFALSNNGNAITDTIATLAAGASQTITVTALVAASTPAGSIANTATATTSTSDPNLPTHGTSTANTIITTQADVTVVKTGPATATSGGQITYQITTQNNGPSDAQNVLTSDTLPAHTTLVSFVQNTGPANGGTLPLGGTQTFTLVLNVDANTPDNTLITNTAQVTTSTNDPNLPTNGHSVVNTTVHALADVTILKTGPATATSGGQITYQITTQNNGPSDAQGVTTSDTLPAHTTLVSFVQNTGPLAGGTLPAGGTQTFTLVVKVDANTPDNTVITNTANVSTTTNDPNLPTNGHSSVNTTVHALADLAVTKTGPRPAIAGTNFTYTITVTNNGGSDAQNVALTDTLPSGTTLVGQSQGGGPAFTLGSSGNSINDTIASLPAGSSQTIFVTAHLPANAAGGGHLSNTANVSSTTLDPNLGNNSATFTSSVGTVADLALTISGPAIAAPGGTITYLITLTNNGPSDASHVLLNDALPGGTTFVSQSQGGGPAFVLSHSGNSIGDTLLSMPAGTTQTFSIVAKVNGSHGSKLNNFAAVYSFTADPNLVNNSGSVSTTVASGSAPVAIHAQNVRLDRAAVSSLTAVDKSHRAIRTLVSRAHFRPAQALPAWWRR